ncbi:MAG: hypothetical protein H7Z40_10405 [Phycisphaerae bacterium]|nr:hypothetical protein [Gemmatimonadaceae bacterium]
MRGALLATMLLAVRVTDAQPAAPRPAPRARVTVIDSVTVVDVASAARGGVTMMLRGRLVKR